MKSFESYFTEDQIIYYLCRVRAKIAKQRSKQHLYHLLTDNKKYNYHKPIEEKISDYQKKFLSDLMSIMPPRKKWKELDAYSRYKPAANGNKLRITTVDKNIYSLLRTIKYYKERKPNEPFILKLNEFIADINKSITEKSYSIIAPSIYPKPKKLKSLTELGAGEKNICRPIALFNLKDRLILSFTNKFFTQVFDPYFHECALAFRAPTKDKIISHHNAVDKILQFKKKNFEKPLWVAECDMQKFYDSVNHKVIRKYFYRFINKAKKDYPGVDLNTPTNIFLSYLNCYSFNDNILQLNNNEEYWNRYNIARGEFGWVEKDLKRLNYYNQIPTFLRFFAKKIKNKNISDWLEKYSFAIYKDKIGIPQGGALSGLIANLVLDYTDKETLKTPGIFYIRFCDDMILMHSEKKLCDLGIKRYQKSLKKLKLVPHSFSILLRERRIDTTSFLPQYTFKPFWKEKSKGPYKWAAANDDGFPWIGFVGYEIHYDGYVRVRKSSLEKEYNKQIEIVNKLKQAIRIGKKVHNSSVCESAAHQLIGMSVGRVQIWNYEATDNEMCWKNGFKALTANKYSIKQLKLLDRNRNKLYYDLIRELNVLYQDNFPPKEKKKRRVITFDKPFSYYYHFVNKAPR